jgi:hypothetical protein
MHLKKWRRSKTFANIFFVSNTKHTWFELVVDWTELRNLLSVPLDDLHCKCGLKLVKIPENRCTCGTFDLRGRRTFVFSSLSYKSSKIHFENWQNTYIWDCWLTPAPNRWSWSVRSHLKCELKWLVSYKLAKITNDDATIAREIWKCEESANSTK